MGYQDLSSAFVYKQTLFATKLDQLGENDKYLKDNNIEDWTKVVFLQTSVPIGYTQSVSDNDAFLRVVSGIGGGVGGTLAPSSNLTLNHNHNLTVAPDHQHDLANHAHNFGKQSVSGYSSSSSNYIIGKGNFEMRFQQPGGSSIDYIGTATESSIYNNTPSGLGGTHNHSLSDSVTDTNFAYVDIIIGIKDSSIGYVDMTSHFSHNEKINFQSMESLEGNDNFLKDHIPVFGSKMVWFQSSSPDGWTQATTVNDKALRIVSGAGSGTGGTQAIGTALNLNHAHSSNNVAGHSHQSNNHQHNFISGGTNNLTSFIGFEYLSNSGSFLQITDGSAVSRTVYKGRTALDGSGTSSVNPVLGHSHSIASTSGYSFQFLYLDMIEASKDSTGAPFVFQDLSGASTNKKLVSKQRLNNHGENDSYLKFHTIPSTSKAIFYQATAPLNWTQKTTQDDKCLRIVNGTGGGSGGVDGLFSGLALSHTHGVENNLHAHSINHIHNIDSETNANAGNNTTSRVYDDGSRIKPSAPGGQTLDLLLTSMASVDGSLLPLYHGHGGVTLSGLTTQIYKYVDVILCEKD